MNRDLLLDFRTAKMERNLNVYGVVVRQHGEIIAEHRYRSNDFVQMYSVSKTVTAIAAGLAMDEGYFKLTDKVVSFFPEKVPVNPCENLSNMTVRDLLCMGTGHAITSLDVHYYDELFKEDWITHILARPVEFEPGTHFEYDNGATYLVSAIIQKTTGNKLRDYLMTRIFDPLKIYNPQWDSCPNGINKGYIGLHLTTEQLSRIGQLLLDNGKWDGKQLIPEAYVKMMSSKQIDNTGYWDDVEFQNGYGFQVWLNTIPNSYRFDGLYGQFCIILPDYDAVVTLTSHQELRQNDIIRLVWDTILNKL